MYAVTGQGDWIYCEYVNENLQGGFPSAMETAMEFYYVLIVGVANGTAATPQWTRPGSIAVPSWGRCSRAE